MSYVGELMTELSSFHRAMLCTGRTVLSQDVCLSIRLSHAGILSKRLNVSSDFLTDGWRHRSSFPHQIVWQCSDGDPPNGDVECRGYEKVAIFYQYLALSQK